MKPTRSSRSLNIKRQSPIPLYFQIENLLQSQILEGVFGPGDQLPTEQQLCERFNVSRSVIRPALQNLVSRGLIERIPGKGTFVSHRKVQESLIKELLGFHEDTLLSGQQPGTELLVQQEIPSSAEIAARLEINAGDPVTYLKRLRFVDNEPHLISETYLNSKFLPGIEDEDLSRGSLYDLLKQRYGLVIAHGKRLVEAILANEEDANLLGIQVGAPLLLLTSLVYLNDGMPIEYSIGKHRADRTRFEVDLIRTDEAETQSSR